ncbi:hypothetical protein V492_02069 [Pseudogymnoascus sp. VKM F-4246]|nr:hypothetical protein V492_02069 [Pseudogymnoascus sp. VKM F-4246]
MYRSLLRRMVSWDFCVSEADSIIFGAFDILECRAYRSSGGTEVSWEEQNHIGRGSLGFLYGLASALAPLQVQAGGHGRKHVANPSPERYSSPEIPSFLPDDGIDNYRACMKLAEIGPLTSFTPAESKIIDQLGPHVRPMMRTVMNECMEYIERDMMVGQFNRKIFDLHRHLGKIMQLGNRVVELWCNIFGSVEVFADSWNVRVRRDEELEYDEQVDEVVSQLKDHASLSKRRQLKKTVAKKQGRCLVYLNSSPQAIKMLVICMVTDRIHALDELRLQRRQETGATLVNIEDVPSDARDCPICREALGLPNELGDVECPVRLVSCCGQYAGDRCLQEWYRSPEGRSCPLCRRTPSSSFFEKLYQVEFPFASTATVMFLVRTEQYQPMPTLLQRGTEISEDQFQALEEGRDVSVTIGDNVMMVRQETAADRAFR